MPKKIEKKLLVPADTQPIRLDLFLTQRFPDFSRRYWREQIDAILINGKKAKKGSLVQAGMLLELPELPARSETLPLPNPQLALEVLAEDEFFLAIHKPIGMPSHPLKAGETDTAVNAVLARFPGQATLQPGREAGLVHRLDNGTSGVLLFARTQAALETFQKLSRYGGMRKIYLARVVGKLEGRGKIEWPIGHHKNPKKMQVAFDAAAAKACAARPAITQYRVLENTEDTTLLEIEIAVGTRHQIRAHLAALGYPILGDSLYGGPPAPRLALHALELQFTHPFTSKEIRILASPPKNFF